MNMAALLFCLATFTVLLAFVLGLMQEDPDQQMAYFFGAVIAAGASVFGQMTVVGGASLPNHQRLDAARSPRRS